MLNSRLALALGALALGALWPARQYPKPARIRLVPITSDTRMEDIQESRDGTLLLTHDRGYAPKLWDAKSLSLLAVLGSRTEGVERVTFSPNGERILTMSRDSAHIWDARRAHDLGVVRPPITGDHWTSCAVSGDSNWVALGTEKGNVVVCMINRLAPAQSWNAHTQEVLDLKFAASGDTLVSASKDKLAKAWDPASGRLLATYRGHEGPVRWIQISPDSSLVLTTGLDNVARLYHRTTGQLVFAKTHYIGRKGTSAITLMCALFVGPSGECVLCASEGGLMEVFDRASGAKLRELKGHSASVREIRESRDLTKVATASEDNSIKMWDALTGKELPFTQADTLPTAGEFSTDGNVFWMGSDTGEITRHDLRTGKITHDQTGRIWRVQSAHVSPDLKNWYFQFSSSVLFGQSYQNMLFHPETPGDWIRMRSTDGHPVFSADGRYLLNIATDDTGTLLDQNRQERLIGLKKLKGGAFSSDGKRLYTWHEGGTQVVWNTSTCDSIRMWKAASDISSADYSPDGKYALTEDTKSVFSLSTCDDGHVVGALGKFFVLPRGHGFSPDSKYVLLWEDSDIHVFSTGSAKAKWHLKIPADKSMVDQWYVGAKPFWSPDSKRFGISNSMGIAVWDVSTGRLVSMLPQSASNVVEPNSLISKSSARILQIIGTTVNVVDIDSGKALFSIDAEDAVEQASYVGDGSRLLIIDRAGSVALYNSTTGHKLGAMVRQPTGGWLVLDPEGRYDASDPSKVDCASYVLEWAGGLEPIDVAQLKQQFYDPGLFAKIVGVDPERRRPVADLAELHLCPSVELSPTKASPLELAIKLKERDNGGIGRVNVFVNGKLLEVREGAGFFTVDLRNSLQFLLPDAQLNGKQNVVTVTATNETGNLTSEAVTYQVPTPEGLKTPEVHFYALCVGIGDYAGTAGDLNSPPSDASALAIALRTSAERLLPKRVHVDTLVTSSGPSPTRAAILDWMRATAKTATSSDIVLVFLAGHGCNQIGNDRDYFFLTSESDPSDLNALSAKTGAISGADLKSLLAAIPAAKQIVVLDTCHSGAAAKSLVGASRSISGDYQRAYESIRDTTGTWMLAGSAADQLSYESSSVDHGILTYALLEAIDNASAEGLRKGSDNQMFLDVDRWLNYAANRVESLRNEIGLAGIQRPEFKRSALGASFDIGVVDATKHGTLGLRAPRPIVIMGTFQKDEEDPAGLEKALVPALKDSSLFKLWTDVNKHPNVYRTAGTYTVSGGVTKVKVFLQKFDADENRQTIETFTVEGATVAVVAGKIRAELDTRVERIARAQK